MGARRIISGLGTGVFGFLLRGTAEAVDWIGRSTLPEDTSELMSKIDKISTWFLEQPDVIFYALNATFLILGAAIICYPTLQRLLFTSLCGELTRHKYVSAKLVLFRKRTRDTPLRNAAFYIMTGKWYKTESELNNAGLYGANIMDMEITLRQAAADGHILIWGLHGGVWAEIAKDWWISNDINNVFSTNPAPNSGKYAQLMCSKTEIRKTNWEKIRVSYLKIHGITSDII